MMNIRFRFLSLILLVACSLQFQSGVMAAAGVDDGDDRGLLLEIANLESDLAAAISEVANANNAAVELSVRQAEASADPKSLGPKSHLWFNEAVHRRLRGVAEYDAFTEKAGKSVTFPLYGFNLLYEDKRCIEERNSRINTMDSDARNRCDRADEALADYQHHLDRESNLKIELGKHERALHELKSTMERLVHSGSQSAADSMKIKEGEIQQKILEANTKRKKNERGLQLAEICHEKLVKEQNRYAHMLKIKERFVVLGVESRYDDLPPLEDALEDDGKQQD